MQEYNWNEFKVQDFNCYSIYMYLVIAHRLSIEIMKTLIRFGVCESEAIVMNRTMKQLLCILERRRYYGSFYEFENDCYSAEFQKKNRLVKIVDMFTNNRGLIFDILSNHPNIRYEWHRDYIITRNCEPVSFKKFLNTIKSDLH